MSELRLEELRNLLMSERETGKLVEIPPDLFEGAQIRLKELERAVKEVGDPLSEKTHELVEEIFSIRETIHDIFRIRVRKILALAQTGMESPEDRDEMKKMHPSEQEMYRTIVRALEECRRAMMETGMAGGAEKAPGVESTHADTGEGVPAGPPACSPYDRVTVLILKEMEPFFGVDGQVYHLKEGDLVTLPRIHAEILCTSDIALNINHGT